MNRWLPAAWVLVLGLALGLRTPQLALRPFHNDEGNNAMKFRALYVNNDYRYDPSEFHGPTLPYLTLPAAWLDGGGDFNRFTEPLFRAVTVAFGVGLILLLPLLARDLGRAETLWAGAFTALSPAMVFYSRYYIHEMLLVFFTFLAFVCYWRWRQSGRAAWAAAGGLALGMMSATKETYVLTLVAMALAGGTAAAWARWREGGTAPPGTRWKWPHLALALAVAAGAWALLFTSFLTNAAGPLDAVRTYLPNLRRAGGATLHGHPWTFYFQRLFYFHVRGGPVWSEGLIAALAAIGFFAALAGRVLLPRLIAFYTFWLTLIYTLISYKTPWCALGFYHGAILLAGAGAATLWRACRNPRSRAAVALALAAGLAHLGWQAWLGNFGLDRAGVPYCDSPKNPCVYSQTLPDALRLVATVEGLARASKSGDDTTIEVMSPESYWPLPWYLRRFRHAGYWDHVPDQPLVPIMIVSANLHAAFDERPEKTHLMAGYFELRPAVFLELYAATNLWAGYVKTLPPEKD
jgi:uncharacterized protein (TIGR03663 family)